MPLIPEQREELEGQMERLDCAVNLLEEQIKPLRTAVSIIQGEQDLILEKHGINCHWWEIEKCESCGDFILEGDKRFAYEDGPTFCAEHAPTFAESEAQALEWLTTLRNSPETDGEDLEDAQDTLAHIRAQIAEGRGDEKNVW